MLDIKKPIKINSCHKSRRISALVDSSINQNKWYVEITLVINSEHQIKIITLINYSGDQNCIKEGLVSIKYYEKTNYFRG
jgi:hypothetical protein